MLDAKEGPIVVKYSLRTLAISLSFWIKLWFLSFSKILFVCLFLPFGKTSFIFFQFFFESF